MSLAGDDLTLIQAKLHDGGALWSRAELLTRYNSGYRELLAKSSAMSRLRPLDVPGRHTYAISYPWESRHTSGGTWWFPMLAYESGARQVMSQWEVEHLDGATPTASLTGLTQQWERANSGETDRHFSFGLPVDHERVRRLEWNNRVLLPVSVREFDETDDAWMRRVGEPSWWTIGTGPVRSVEVYEMTTEYQQAYQLLDYQTGLPRGITGDRTYTAAVDSYNPSNAYAYSTQGDKDALTQAPVALLTGMGYFFTQEPTNKSLGFPIFDWELQQLNGVTVTVLISGGVIGMFPWESIFGAEAISFGVGGVRSLSSPDRQYLPMVSEAASSPILGGIRDWRSSEENVMVLEVVVQPVELDEKDAPVLIPPPLQKYLRCYVLAWAFGREGEGQRVDLAQHYDQRFQRGVMLFKRLADVAHADRTFQRQLHLGPRNTPPLVRLPPQFEEVW